MAVISDKNSSPTQESELSATDLNFEPPKFSKNFLKSCIKEHYALRGQLKPLDGEREQNHLLICDDGNRFVVKVYSPFEDPGVMDFHNRALLHVEQQDPGLMLPRLQRTLSGDTTVPVTDGGSGLCTLRVLSFIPGVPIGDPSNPTMFHLGQLLGRLSLALRGLFHPAAQHFMPWDISKAVILNPSLHARIQDDVLPLVTPFLQRMEEKILPQLTSLRAQVIYNDGHADNILKRAEDNEEIAGFIDFGDIVHAPLIQDVAVSMACFSRGDDDTLGGITQLLKGYHHQLPLERGEIELLPDLIMARLVTSLMLYDFRISHVQDSPEFLSLERPGIVQKIQLFTGLGSQHLTDAFLAACGFPPKVRGEINSKNLLERREKGLAPSYHLFYETPVHLVRGEGVWLFDSDGRQYLDCYNNVASVGHCHPRVVAALSRQAATLNTHTRYLHENVVRLSEKLTASMPEPLDTCIFVCTGTEANDLALRISRAVSSHEGAVVVDNSYHGNSTAIAAMSTCNYPPEKQPDWLATIEPPNLYRGSYRSDDPQAGAKYADLMDVAIDTLNTRGKGIAAFMCDSIFDSQGTLVAPAGYFARTYEKVRKAGGLCIADEVQSGYGRLGRNMWEFARHDVIPDIVTLGKPMGDGHPLAALVTTADIARKFADSGFGYFNTFGGNAVSAAVGLAVLDVIEEERLVAQAGDTGDFLHAGLDKLASRYDYIGELRGRGLFYGLEIVRDSESRETDPDKASAIVNRMLEKGVLMGATGLHDHVVKIRPPLVFNKEHAQILLSRLAETLQELA